MRELWIKFVSQLQVLCIYRTRYFLGGVSEDLPWPTRIDPSRTVHVVPRSADPDAYWGPTPVVHIPNGTITGVVSTRHTAYTLIGTDSAHRGMNILCRLSIGLPTWHNAPLLHIRARARVIMRRESFARGVCVCTYGTYAHVQARSRDRGLHVL
jgi:hypothetical protein